MEHWTPVFVGLGSNLDEPVRQIQAAFVALSELEQCRLLARSPLFRSAPMGPQDQPWYVNAVAGLLTRLDPHRLLDELQALERSFGRAASASAGVPAPWTWTCCCSAGRSSTTRGWSFLTQG